MTLLELIKSSAQQLTDAGVFAAEYGCYTANDTGLADAEQKELHGET